MVGLEDIKMTAVTIRIENVLSLWNKHQNPEFLKSGLIYWLFLSQVISTRHIGYRPRQWNHKTCWSFTKTMITRAILTQTNVPNTSQLSQMLFETCHLYKNYTAFGKQQVLEEHGFSFPLLFDLIVLWIYTVNCIRRKVKPSKPNNLI